MYGAGATELDALEALHPGELHRILVAEIERNYDTTLDGRIDDVAGNIETEIDQVNAAVDAEFEPELAALQAEIAALNERIRLHHHGRERALCPSARY
jgi:phage host-nuclease inhibitor protein Gam